MPSIYCHYLEGAEALSRVSFDDIGFDIEKYIDVFNLGTQGGDVFFYYNSWPFKPSSYPKNLGDRLHTENVQSFFHSALEYISEKSGKEKEVLLSYMFGYICHYCLDANTHPFIFYSSGFSVSEDDGSDEYKYYHRKFETALDVIMLSRIALKKPRELKGFSIVTVDRFSKKTIADMYSYVLKEAYDVDLSDSVIESALSSMANAQRLLCSRWGFKKKLLEILERATGGSPLVSPMVHPQSIDDGLDYLNLCHRNWALPWDSSEVNSDSFLELFDKSVSEAVVLFTEFSSVAENGPSASLSREKWNRSFSTGEDCEANLSFKYSDIIFKRK